MKRAVKNGVTEVANGIRPLLRNGSRTKQTVCYILLLVVSSIVIFTVLHTTMFFFSANNDFGDDEYFSYFKHDLDRCWVDPLLGKRNTKGSSRLSKFRSDVMMATWPTQLSYVYCNKGTRKHKYSNSTIRRQGSLVNHYNPSALFTSHGSVRPDTRFVSLLTADTEKPFAQKFAKISESGSSGLSSTLSASTCSPTLQLTDTSSPTRLFDAGMCGEYTSQHTETNIKCLPSFIIVGAMKAGTGELMKWLEKHPQLRAAHAPTGALELHFFSQTAPTLLASVNQRHLSLSNSNAVKRANLTYNIDRLHHELLMSYLEMMPAMSELETRSVYTFEKSPDYIRDPAALQLIRQLLPSIRLILTVRDPAKRTASEFAHNCRHGRYAEVISDSVTVSSKSSSSVRSASSGNSTDGTTDSSAQGAFTGTAVAAPFDKYAPVVYRRGDIVRIRGQPSHRNTAGGVSAADADLNPELNAIYGLEQFPAGSLKVIKDCTKGHLHRYFFGSSATTSSSSSSSGIDAPDTLQSEDNTNTHSNWSSTGKYSSTTSNRRRSGDTAQHLMQMSKLESERLKRFPEAANSIYNEQVQNLLGMFEADKLLVLLQEDMYVDTIRTLRTIEAFAKIPCFDFRKVAMPPLEWQGPSRSDHVGVLSKPAKSSRNASSESDFRAGSEMKRPAPPLRAPFSVQEKFQYVSDLASLYYEYVFGRPEPAALPRQQHIDGNTATNGGTSSSSPTFLRAELIENKDEENSPLTSGKPMAITQNKLRSFFAPHNTALQRTLTEKLGDVQSDRLVKAGWSVL